MIFRVDFQKKKKMKLYGGIIFLGLVVAFKSGVKTVQAQLVKVPFENVSKLYYKKHHNHQGLPNLEFFLDGIERFHFGGTCYSNNYCFYQLLVNLGYQIKLCGADMFNPDVHLVSVVTVEQQEYLVDVGYAAPFLTPLPRDLTTDYVIVLGRDQYVLKPQDAQGCSQMLNMCIYQFTFMFNRGYLVKFPHFFQDSPTQFPEALPFWGSWSYQRPGQLR